MGARTLLIDADLRNPRQHVLFGLHNGTGLSTILADRADRSVVQGIAGPLDLSVLTGGASPPNPSELLNRNAFSALLADLSAGFDVIILDAPAAQLGADAQLIALRSNGALLVARRNRTSIDDCRDLAEAIRTSGSTVVGSVINEA
jgi:receptor protein-tyrosine kinase